MSQTERSHKLKHLLPALALLTASCTPDMGTATLYEKFSGCVASEKIVPEYFNSHNRLQPQRHELSVVFFGNGDPKQLTLLSVGEYSKKIDQYFNPADLIELSITLRGSYRRSDPQSRIVVDSVLKSRLNRILNTPKIALDETESEIKLRRIDPASCLALAKIQQ